MFFDPIYLLIALLVFAVNVMPALMPPTWVILAFFYIHFNLLLMPIVLIGAASATLGRTVLFWLAKHHVRRFIPQRYLENYDILGQFLHKSMKVTVPIVLIYAFFPIPSNQLFIIAGLTRLKIKIIAFSFLAGRLISYTFWISVVSSVADRLDLVFSNYFSNFGSFVVEILGLVLIYFIGKINWRKILKIKEVSRTIP